MSPAGLIPLANVLGPGAVVSLEYVPWSSRRKPWLHSERLSRYWPTISPWGVMPRTPVLVAPGKVSVVKTVVSAAAGLAGSLSCTLTSLLVAAAAHGGLGNPPMGKTATTVPGHDLAHLGSAP